jgi:HEAT repeat protein
MSHTEQMGKKRRILLAFLIVAVIGTVVWEMVVWERMPRNEPVYMGKPLSYWLKGYDQLPIYTNRPPVSTRYQADQAVREIGTNCIPALLRMLQQPNPSLIDRIVALAQKQHLIKIPFTPANLNEKAFWSFMALGSAASNAVPQLVAIFEKNPASFPQMAAPAILGKIGHASEPAIPGLLRGIGNTNRSVRCSVIFALGQIHTRPKLVVPALMKCLNDPDLYVRASAVQALGEFGHDAQTAVPALLELRRKSPSAVGLMTIRPICGVTSSSVEMFSGPFTSVSDGPMSPDIVATTTEALKQIGPEAAAGNLFDKWYGPPAWDEKHPVETLH